MIRGTIKSKQITMMRITNSIVVAFVSVLFFNSHYNHAGVGMVAAAASGGGAGTGGEEADTTTRGTMLMTVEGVPVPTRKLSKNSKASKPDAAEAMDAVSLVRSLVFYVYRSMQNGGRELQQTVADIFKDYSWDDCLALYLGPQNEDLLCGYSFGDCLALYEGVQNEDFFCREVSPLISAYILDALYSAGVFDDLDDVYAFGIDDFYERLFSPKSTYESCMDIMQCPSTYAIEDGYLFQNTPSMCCGDQYPLPFGQPEDSCSVTLDRNRKAYEPCMDIMQCPSTYAFEDGYLLKNTQKGDEDPLPLGQPGDSCSVSTDCAVIVGSEPPRAVCREGQCQSGKSGSSCGQTRDCLPIAELCPPRAVCLNNGNDSLYDRNDVEMKFECQKGVKYDYCANKKDCVSGICKRNVCK